MAPWRMIVIVLVIVTSFFASGCMMLGGDSKGGTAKKSLFGSREPEVAKRDGERDDYAEFSPEVSMQRDLLQLREREARQKETVESMRVALNQGRDDIQREEERLQEIQQQIDRYDNAMRRYEQASRYATTRDDLRRDMASVQPQPRDYPAEREYASRNAPDTAPSRQTPDYGRSIPDRSGNAYPADRDSRFAVNDRNGYPAASREEVLYAAEYDPRLPAQAQLQQQMQPQTRIQAPARSATRFTPRFEDESYQSDMFSVPSGLSAQPAQAQPVVRQSRIEDQFPDDQMFADAAPRQKTQWPPAAQQKAAVAPAPTPVISVPASQMPPPAPDYDGMDEVFTPDLFLSRR